MARDRITELLIKGLRSIDDLTLDLKGLTVLIGENGSGKSTIIEALEILRRAASPQFTEELNQVHGGLFGLLRKGAPGGLELGVKVEGDGPDLHYRIHLVPSLQGHIVAGEQLRMESSGQATMLIVRTRHDAKASRAEGTPPVPRLQDVTTLGSSWLLLPELASPTEPIREFSRMKRALEQIEVHVPFEVTASWVARAHQRRSDARSQLEPVATSRLARLASNLANVFHRLHTEFGSDHWVETTELVRLGLGDSVDEVVAKLGDAGSISLWLKLKNLDDWLPATSLSDGQLAYLAFVALYRLPRPERSILVFDEPDLHLHPDLVVRVVDFFDTLSDDHPVILSTHSDRLLDSLTQPAESVRICDLVGAPPMTRVRKLDPVALKNWLQDYRGLGDIRGDGFLSEIVEAEAQK